MDDELLHRHVSKLLWDEVVAVALGKGSGKEVERNAIRVREHETLQLSL